MATIKFGILTVSDTCYEKKKEDRSGPKLEECVKDSYPNSTIVVKAIVPDDKHMIQHYLTLWSLNTCDVILTTGGTGFSPRDVTPEATKAVIDKEAPSLSNVMLSRSLEVTEMAMLSRSVCGIKNQTIIINLPGSAKGASECFGFVKKIIPHAVALVTNNNEIVNKTHCQMQGLQFYQSPSQVKINQVAARNRQSSYPLLEVSKALEIIFSECNPIKEIEAVDIMSALHRVLAEDVYSQDPLPPFPASIKDGYAVKAADGAGIRIVRDAVIAGNELKIHPLQSGEVIRISTGAAVPTGADAVVQVEDTVLVKASQDGTEELEIEIKIAPKIGQDIRQIGSDIPLNSLVLNKNDFFNASHVGVLATVGKTSVNVFKRPTVTIISTGNELQYPHEKLKPGHVRDSNKMTLLNLFQQYNYKATDSGIARDEPNEVRATLERAFSLNDVIVTTGGVSMGERDIIKQVLLADFKAEIHFGRVNMKPGKPTTFATCDYKGHQKVIFGLPGNPVSATVTSILFVIPALRFMENRKNVTLPHISVALGTSYSLDPRPEYIRVQLKRKRGENTVWAYPTGDQISSRLNSFIDAGAFLCLPGKNTEGWGGVCQKGDIMDALLLEPLNIHVQ